MQAARGWVKERGLFRRPVLSPNRSWPWLPPAVRAEPGGSLRSTGEKSRIPAWASRLAWTRGESGHVVTIGIGGYHGRQNYGAG